jgi:hypothetical protein
LSDYPNEPIGGGNPYWRCVSCKRSDPEINGRLEGHLKSCEWRQRQEEKEREAAADARALAPQHTRGPWTFREDGGFEIVGFGAEPVGHLAELNGKEPSAEDLNLILAAPDLLAAAKLARSIIRAEVDCPTETERAWIEALTAAIERAEGRS